MPLISCKVHVELNWTKNCVMYGRDVAADNNNDETIFKITNIKLYVPIVTLSTEDNVKLTKQLNEGFKRTVYWNEYKAKIESRNSDDNLTRFYLDASFKGIKRLFVIAFNNATVNVPNNPINNTNNKVVRDSDRKYFLPRVNITNYNVFEHNMSTDIKLSKTQISRIIKSGRFLVSLLSKIAGPLMKVAVPLAKNILALLGITAAASETDAGIKKKHIVLEQQL